MRTPAGFDCPYFYGNYHRGKNEEECRLIGDVAAPKNWAADLCKKCPVPGILRANACTHMTLRGEVRPGFLKLGRGIQVSAYCTKSQQIVKEPYVGCGQCHPIPPIFNEKNSA